MPRTGAARAGSTGRDSGGGAADGIVRPVTGFHQDDAGDWVAELSCLHSQHMRHEPPFQNRPWVVGAQGRQSRLGMPVRCLRCERAEMPAGLALLRTAGPFTQETLPAGLRRSHRTAAGVWARLTVASGSLGFRLEVRPPLDLVLAAGRAQPIPPEVPHCLAVTGPVRLSVEFWGAG